MSSNESSQNAWERAVADPALVVTNAVSAIDHALTRLPPKVVLQLLEFVRCSMDATEARVLADRFDAGASERDVEDLVRSQNNTSKAEAQRRAKRAKATNANPDIASKMKDGKLSTEQADTIADAAAETDGAAACDEELIDDIANASPEQGKKKARSYVNERRSGDEIQKKHDAQRRRRTVYRYRTKDGDHVLAFQGDKTTIDQMERKVNAGADSEYREDGGRDIPRHKHRRTHDQRRFDAAHKLICSKPKTEANAGGSGRKSAVRSSALFIIKMTASDLKNPDTAVFTSAEDKPCLVRL